MPFRPCYWLALLVALWIGGFGGSSVSAALLDVEGQPFSPAGLTIYLLITDPSAPGTVYLSVASGLFKSTDGGRTWFWSGRGLGEDGLDALIFDPSRPGTLYALSDRSANLFGSTDGGTSWRRLGSPPLEDHSTSGGELAIDGAGTIYAAIEHVLVATSDRGGTWDLLRDFKAPIQTVAIDPTAPGTLYVATSAVGGGVPAQFHKSGDGGRTWREIGGDILPPDVGQRMGTGTVFLEVAATRPATVYAGVTSQGIYRSTDGGMSWSRLALGQPGEYLSLTDLIVDRVDPSTLYVAYGGASSRAPGRVAVSHDGGATWRNRDDDLSFSFGAPRMLAVDSSTGALFAAESGNLQVSTEKQPWRHLIRHSMGGSFPVGKVRFRPRDPSIVHTLLAGQHWKSADGGKTWTAFSAAPGAPFLSDLVFDVADPNILYGAAATGVFRSGDGGESWTQLHGAAANTLVLPRPGTILAGGCGIARSTDGGTTWREVLPCQGASFSDRREIESLRVNAAAPNEILSWVKGWVKGSRIRSVYRSRDGGATWDLVTGASFVTRDATHPQTLYAAMGDDWAKSTDDGATWTTIGSFGGIGEISELVIDPARPDTLYAFTSYGLVRSRGGGRTWGPLERFQFRAVNVATFLPHPTVPHLFYVGGSNGIYEVRLEP